jgi:hypothetical protein
MRFSPAVGFSAAIFAATTAATAQEPWTPSAEQQAVIDTLNAGWEHVGIDGDETALNITQCWDKVDWTKPEVTRPGNREAIAFSPGASPGQMNLHMLKHVGEGSAEGERRYTSFIIPLRVASIGKLGPYATIAFELEQPPPPDEFTGEVYKTLSLIVMQPDIAIVIDSWDRTALESATYLAKCP